MKQKIKIMKQQPQLSDEEIRSYMDFEGLLANRKLASKPKFHLLKWFVPAVAVIGVGAWLVFSPRETVNQQATIEIQNNGAPAASQGDTPPVSNKETVTIPAETENSKVAPEQKSLPAASDQKGNKSPNETVTIEPKPADDVYIQAEPVDGYSELYAYFNSNLVYPAEALQDSIQGVETVSFIINIEGKPEKITVKNSLGEPFEKEARRLIENMPLWKPATLNGTPVPSQMSVPLTFQIQKVNVNR